MVQCSMFVETALGRRVPVQDWQGIQTDAILRVLYGVRLSPFNPHNMPTPLDSLRHATGLPAADVQHLCANLIAENKVASPGYGFYSITDVGLAYVNGSPVMQRRSGSFGPGFG